MVQAEVLKTTILSFLDSQSALPGSLPGRVLFEKSLLLAPHFFTPGGGTGVRVTLWHFSLPVLLPVTRPEASRCVPLNDPDELPLVVELPVSRPEASRYWVLVAVPLPLPVRVSALPARRPLASR